MPDPADAFRMLLHELSAIYAREGRPGADTIAAVYAEAAERAPDPAPAAPYVLDDEIHAATEGAEHPAAVAARAAHRVLRWSATGILDRQIPPSVSDMFAVVSIVGPGAMIEASGVRGGLFMQRTGCYYPLHAHAAEETYAMLAGEAEWTVGDGAPVTLGPGSFSFHPADAPHATRTRAQPILAAWRWSGDIGLESYRLLEDVA